MKTHLLRLLFALLPSALLAQETTSLKFGINAGATYSSFRIKDAGNNLKAGAGFMVGASIEMSLSNSFALLANVNYERKLFRNSESYFIYEEQFYNDYPEMAPSDAPGGWLKLSYNDRLDYITIPLSLKYYILPQSKLYIHGGPFASYLISKTFKFDSGNSMPEWFADISNIRGFDYGFTIGLGTRFNVAGKRTINAELRNSMGLKNVAYQKRYQSESKTNSLMIVLNYQLN
jgi:opacity protein-like surface antigen